MSEHSFCFGCRKEASPRENNVPLLTTTLLDTVQFSSWLKRYVQLIPEFEISQILRHITPESGGPTSNWAGFGVMFSVLNTGSRIFQESPAERVTYRVNLNRFENDSKKLAPDGGGGFKFLGQRSDASGSEERARRRSNSTFLCDSMNQFDLISE